MTTTVLESMTLNLSGTPIQGPQGPQGDKGDKGDKGDTGAAGAAGAQGPQGVAGVTGPKGDVGPAGPQGPQGEKGDKGEKGDPGAVGPQGPAGAKGDKGDAGPAGLKGDKGDTGPAGAAGAKGDTGTTGPQGPKGDAGPTGATGPKGDKGDKGDAGTGLNNRGSWAPSTYQPGDYVFASGSNGQTSMWILADDVAYISSATPLSDATHWIEFQAPQGPKGDTGATGATGATGPKGDSGATGAIGPAGADGKSVELQKTATAIQWRQTAGVWADLVTFAAITGPTGATGTNGADGKSIELQKTATAIQWRQIGGTWADLVLLSAITGPQGAKGDAGTVGATGPAGADGNTILTTSGAPSAATGKNGDYAIDPTAQIIYGPKAAGAWPAGVSYKGAAGTGGTGSVTLATSAQAKAATAYDIATTPAGVREYLEQFGLTSTYTDTATDLDTLVKGGLFNWGSSTLHIPVASSYGRGITIPSGTDYVTQLSIENTTGKVHVRFQDNGTWSAWKQVSSPIPTGGTTGQVLSKKSATDYDMEWTTPAAGGGGSSGGSSPVVYQGADKSINASAYTAMGMKLGTVPLTGVLYRITGMIMTQGDAAGSISITMGNEGATVFRLTARGANASGQVIQSTTTQDSVAATVPIGPTQDGIVTLDGLALFTYVATTGPDLNIKLASGSWCNILKGSHLAFTPIGTMSTIA